MAKQPKVYSTKLTAHQNATLARFEALTGTPPSGLSDFEADRLTAVELWRQQVAWVEGVYDDVCNMSFGSVDETV